MTAEAKEPPRFRALVVNMWGSQDAAPHDAEFRYWADHPPEAVLSENYFLPCIAHFHRGDVAPGQNPYQGADEIRVTCYRDDGSWVKGRVEVQYADEHTVRVKLIEGWRAGGGEPDLELDAKYLGFRKGGASWGVFHKATGKTYRQAVTKAEAERLVGHPLGQQDGEAA